MEENKEEINSENVTQGNFNDNLHGENLTERAKVLSPGMTVAKRFFRSKLSVIGLAVLIILFVFSFLGPLFSPWSAAEGTVKDYNSDLIKDTYTVFRVEYVGADGETYEGRVSLTIGFVVILIETLLGVLLGGLAGYFGKWVDQLIMRIVDILSCIPTLPLMLILSVVFTNIFDVSKLYYMMGILCLIGWPGTARLVRGQILSLREQEFMLAAKCSGLSTSKKIFKHLVPNIIPQLIVSMTLGLGSIILTEATLGYLNLGAPLTTATWGNMINLAAQSTYRQYYPNLWLGAGICITLAILAFNFVGDGLRDAFDPKMKR